MHFSPSYSWTDLHLSDLHLLSTDRRQWKEARAGVSKLDSIKKKKKKGNRKTIWDCCAAVISQDKSRHARRYCIKLSAAAGQFGVRPVQWGSMFQDLCVSVCERECVCVCMRFLCQVSSLCLDRPGQSGSPLCTLQPNTHIYQNTAQQQAGCV